MVSIVDFGPSCRGFDFQRYQNFFRRKIVDVAEATQRPCLEESGQWLENVDQMHLVLASGDLFCSSNYY